MEGKDGARQPDREQYHDQRDKQPRNLVHRSLRSVVHHRASRDPQCGILGAI